MRSYSRRRRLMNLPLEILIDILKRLPAKQLCRLRCVSKTLLRIVDCPYFVALHTALQNGAVPQEPPHLIIHLVRSRDEGRRHITSSLQSLKYESGQDNVDVSDIFSISVGPEQIDDQYNVYFVFNDLFCMKHWRKHDLCFLIDPFRGDFITLPESNNVDQVKNQLETTLTNVALGMGLDTITNTYKIVRVSQFVHNHVDEGHTLAEVLELGTNFWRKISSTPPTPPLYAVFGINNVYAYGDMHWFVDAINDFEINGDEGWSYPIISFDFKREEFYLTPNPVVESWPWVLDLHLITLRGSMAVVDTSSPANIEIWVMKDYNRKKWARDYVISTVDLGFQFKKLDAFCGEWEHGVFFIDELGKTPVYVDLRSVSANRVICPTTGSEYGFWACRRILSLHGSLVSLKGYTNRLELKSLPLIMTNSIEQSSVGGLDEDYEDYLRAFVD